VNINCQIMSMTEMLQSLDQTNPLELRFMARDRWRNSSKEVLVCVFASA
jgi:hypothetical protein